MRRNAHCMASEESTGMDRLSLSPNGSYSSVSVAVRAPKKIGYLPHAC